MNVVGTQGKGSVLAPRAVETQGKGSVLCHLCSAWQVLLPPPPLRLVGRSPPPAPPARPAAQTPPGPSIAGSSDAAPAESSGKLRPARRGSSRWAGPRHRPPLPQRLPQRTELRSTISIQFRYNFDRCVRTSPGTGSFSAGHRGFGGARIGGDGSSIAQHCNGKIAIDVAVHQTACLRRKRALGVMCCARVLERG